MKIEDGTVAVIHYTLMVEGELRDTSVMREPLAYLHGHGNIVAGLENGLVGKEAGDSVSVSVAPADGYGEATGNKQAIKKNQLPKNVRAEVGNGFFAAGSDGSRVRLWITKAKGARVWVTTDHPLAGKTLDFEVNVLAVRKATAVELDHGHAHGPDGVAHH